jgi:aspartyl-tRNA(Asn)/glutamyl-tRNA(Gln) amidotransferase subunit A
LNDLVNLSLGEMITILRAGEVSSRDLTLAFLGRIGRLDSSLHAFLTLTPDVALAQADQADQEIKNWRSDPSQSLPALTGVPIAVKDVLCVEDKAGVVILGKTNTDEFAMGSSTENSAYGPTHNPWDLSRVPGGSSGGSAAAIAAGLAPIALGTDTGGSVRQPASFCGVTGIKPTYGRVSRYGLVAYGSSLDVVGALAGSAAEIVPIFQLMAGIDPLDATTADLPVPEIDLSMNSGENSAENSLHGVRVGVPEIEVMEGLGAQVSRVSLPHTEHALPVYYIIAPAEASANLARYDGIRYGPRNPADEMWEIFRRTRGNRFGPEVKRRIMLGTYALSAGYYEAYYGQAQKVRTLIKQDFETVFESVDLVAAPVAPTTSFRIGEHGDDPLSMYLEDIFTLPANLAGVPGIAFPVGFDPAGLPIGMQLMGPHFHEELLFQVAHAYQQVTDWHTRRPNLDIADQGD